MIRPASTNSVPKSGAASLHAGWDSESQIGWAKFSTSVASGPGAFMFVVNTQTGGTTTPVTIQ